MFFGVYLAFSCLTASPCFSKVGGSGRFGESGDVEAAVVSTVVALVLSFVAIIALGDVVVLIGLGVVVVIG